MRIGRLLVPVALAAVAVGWAAGGTPGPLRGAALSRHTGIELLVAADPPFVLDVDSGRVTSVTGIDVADRPVLSVIGVGADAVVWVDRHGRGRPSAELFVLRGGRTRATRLGAGWDVVPVRDLRAVWVKSYLGRGRCTLRELRVDGSTLRAARPVACSTRLVDVGRPVLARAASVADPATPTRLMHVGGVQAIAGHVALTGDARSGLSLADLRSGRRTRLAWPSRVGGPSTQGGVDQAAVDPQNGRMAVSFSDPAWQGGGVEVTDVWVLDPSTGRFRHVPGFPAAVALKFTSMAWTADGRLVVVAESGGHDVVAVWRPGASRLAVRRVRLPDRDSGSDSFAIVGPRERSSP